MIIASSNSDSTFKLQVDTSSNTEACIGTYEVQIVIGLADFPTVAPVTTSITVDVVCPADLTLVSKVEPIVSEMLTTSFTYYVNSLETLTA